MFGPRVVAGRQAGREAPATGRAGAPFGAGTEGGNRTHTSLRKPDFESGASTSFATSACLIYKGFSIPGIPGFTRCTFLALSGRKNPSNQSGF